MSSSDQLVKRLEDLSADVCSDKVTIRNKAIDQVKQILDSSVSIVGLPTNDLLGFLP